MGTTPAFEPLLDFFFCALGGRHATISRPTIHTTHTAHTTTAIPTYSTLHPSHTRNHSSVTLAQTSLNTSLNPATNYP